MTKKDRTIAAAKKFAKYYRKVADEGGRRINCPYCYIHSKDDSYTCYGCPMADKDGLFGCGDFYSFMNLASYFNTCTYPDYKKPTEDDKKILIARAVFHEKIAKRASKMPTEAFTVKGWKFWGWTFKE